MSKVGCGTEEENQARYGSGECGELPPNFMSDLCREHDIVVLKTIRIRDIGVLGEIFRVGGHDVKVIHLLRDPRGVVNSRRRFSHFYLRDLEEVPVEPLTKRKIARAAHDYCDHEYENLRFLETKPGWLRGNYLQVTHTQVSTDPVKTMERMYKFLELEVPVNVRIWAEGLRRTVKSEDGFLTTRKNSTEVMGKWRRELDSNFVKTIEKCCKGLMRKLGMF